MQGELFDLDPSKYVFVFGSIVAENPADGEWITIEDEKPLWTSYVGGQGEETRIKVMNRAGIITVKLAHSSRTNRRFTAMRELDRATGQGKAPVLASDGVGAFWQCNRGYIIESPKPSLGSEVGVWEWKFRVPLLRRVD